MIHDCSDEKSLEIHKDDPHRIKQLKRDRYLHLRAKKQLEKRMVQRLQPVFTKHEKQVKAKIRELFPENQKNDISEELIRQILIRPSQATNDFGQAITTIYYDAVSDGAQAVANFYGIDATDVTQNPEVVGYLKQTPIKTASDIQATTNDSIRKELVEAFREFEGVAGAIQRIEEVYEQAKGYRAERIARTEMTSALNAGRQAEMEELGDTEHQWITSFSNSRTSHENAHLQVVGIKDKFTVKGEKLKYPGDKTGSPGNIINCQCNVAPHVE